VPPRELPDAPQADAVVPVLVGTFAWLVALLVGLVVDAAQPWVGVCAAGLGMGVLGSAFVLRRRAAYRRAGKSGAGQS
jgi:hypothetical protein